MSEEERLFAEVEKLEVHEGDMLVIKAASDEVRVVEALRKLAEQLAGFYNCITVMLGPNDCLSTLSPEVMEAYGWFRKEGQ